MEQSPDLVNDVLLRWIKLLSAKAMFNQLIRIKRHPPSIFLMVNFQELAFLLQNWNAAMRALSALR